MGATSAGGWCGHTPEDATADQHPHDGRRAHRGLWWGQGVAGQGDLVCKGAAPCAVGQIEAPAKGSVGHRGAERNFKGPQDVSETASSGQYRDRMERHLSCELTMRQVLLARD